MRAGRLLAFGCPMAWVIWPEKRRAWELTATDLVEVHTALRAPLPGIPEIEIELADMWKVLDRTE